MTIQTRDPLWGSAKKSHLCETWGQKSARGDVATCKAIKASNRHSGRSIWSFWRMRCLSTVQTPASRGWVASYSSRDFSVITNLGVMGYVSRLFGPGCVDSVGAPNPVTCILLPGRAAYFSPWRTLIDRVRALFLFCVEGIVLCILLQFGFNFCVKPWSELKPSHLQTLRGKIYFCRLLPRIQKPHSTAYSLTTLLRSSGQSVRQTTTWRGRETTHGWLCLGITAAIKV